MPEYFGRKSVIFQGMKSKKMQKELVKTISKMKRKKMIMVKMRAVRLFQMKQNFFKIKEEKEPSDTNPEKTQENKEQE